MNQANTTAAAPFTDWAKAATNIQDAVDVANAGDQIIVTNGVYRFGGRVMDGTQMSRVALTNELTVFSVNGPSFTFIEGTLGSNGTVELWGRPVFSGSNSIRCAFVGSNSILSGFTLTNGYTFYGGAGGGVRCHSSGVVSNCILIGNSAGGVGGGASGGNLWNCVIASNIAVWGGGAMSAKLYGCVFADNYAGEVGGGAMQCTVYNCTITGNSALENGGGLYLCAAYNSIVYHNNLGANYRHVSFENSCTTPLPPGFGNIGDEPQLTSTSHISGNSPCVGAGNMAYAVGIDVDGEPWMDPPSIGADQLVIGAVTGPMTMSMDAGLTNFGPGYSASFIGRNAGRITRSVWDFGDATSVTNQPYVSHAWNLPGTYAVRLIGYNETFPDGIATTTIVHVVRVIHHVNYANPTPLAPYASWETAATTIQDAVDASSIPQAIILVSNGVYSSGGRPGYFQRGRVVIDKPLFIRSVNGPGATIIEGADSEEGGPVRCAEVADRATISGFTLRGGRGVGGSGAFCFPFGVVSNCIIVSNITTVAGGGVANGTIYNCLLGDNLAHAVGGGAYGATLFNCTVVGNSAGRGGGVDASKLYNCICYYNSSGTGPNYTDSQFSDSCTTPQPAGSGNIISEPLFVDLGGRHLRLRPDSPCVNAGNYLHVTCPVDLDGRPRIADLTVDIGAYELQPGINPQFIAWLGQHRLPTDGSFDAIDSDGDSGNNWEEWRAGTNPNDSASVLRLYSPIRSGSNLSLSWESTIARSYFLQRIPSVGDGSQIETIATNVPGQAGVATYTVTNVVNAARSFYRVGVE